MILYGKPVAEKIYETMQKEMEGLKDRPFLAIVLVGENPASLAYVKLKEKIAEKLNIGFKLYHLPEFSSQESVEKIISELNENKYVNGIVVQLPLPEGMETEKIIGLINPKKDTDGFAYQGIGEFPAPTAQAILDILNFYKIDLEGKKFVIIGHGRLVGQPLERLLLKRHITASICDSKTTNLKEKTLLADILISATGVPGLIQPDMVKPDAIVIDAGTAEVGGKMVGDISPEVYEKVASFTPNPGGVGPVTVAELFKNLVDASNEK
ncbi:MAG: FolD bifunctional protein, methylenetetrahydrofolate dehydrogenase (NADP+) / methenyltetrahydrofolate cyclohydrolase [Berkelbacteria bacterium GW2011_GWE1_39_12]|uniref:Bifunctional protein FolD n=1 Tax=Berkelbacteria bacterium GW2011_GWE1_39_12 TaxID=1618337 RepID=A0A0G4B2E9_9BACT|nr:MAG: FolD bifunctional protein, methylenetetrahydrofolate dehydrogenase (NADP+) / methenyltetrahydrofolate cyclohydrolase [Berkelbacteria bacterium GW2011_GWE1_39_12]